MRITLTGKGLELIDTVYPLHLAHEARQLDPLTQAEQQDLIKSLSALLQPHEAPTPAGGSTGTE